MPRVETLEIIFASLMGLFALSVFPIVITTRNRSWRRLVKKYGGTCKNSGIHLSISVRVYGAMVHVFQETDTETMDSRYKVEAEYLAQPGPIFEISRGSWPGEGSLSGIQIGWLRDFDSKFKVFAKDSEDIRKVLHEDRQRTLMRLTGGLQTDAVLSADGSKVTYTTSDVPVSDKLEWAVTLVASVAAHAHEDIR